MKEEKVVIGMAGKSKSEASRAESIQRKEMLYMFIIREGESEIVRGSIGKKYCTKTRRNGTGVDSEQQE